MPELTKEEFEAKTGTTFDALYKGKSTPIEIKPTDLETDEPFVEKVDAPKSIMDSTTRQMRNLSLLATGQETPEEKFIRLDEESEILPKVTREDLEKDEDFLNMYLQHRVDRYPHIVGEGAEGLSYPAHNLIGGKIEDSTNEDYIDDYIDYMRFETQNILDVSFARSWLQDTKDKQRISIERGDTEEANKYANQLLRYKKLHQTWNRFAGLTDSARYENKDALQIMADVAGTVGTNVFIQVADPLTIFTAAGTKLIDAVTVGAARKKAVGSLLTNALASVGRNPIKTGVVTGAMIDGSTSLFLDLALQSNEIEVGIRKEIDYDRATATAAVGAVTGGVLGGVGSMSLTRAERITRGEISKGFKNAVKKAVSEARKTNTDVKNKELADSIREKLAKGIEKNFGKKSIIRNKDGKALRVNYDVMKKKTDDVMLNAGLSDDFFDARLSLETHERVIGALTDIISSARKGDIELDVLPSSNLTPKMLTGKLRGNETVSERMINLVTNIDKKHHNKLKEIFGKYSVTYREIAAATFTEASEAAKILQLRSQLSKNIGRSPFDKIKQTAEDIAEQQADTIYKKLRKNSANLALAIDSGSRTAIQTLKTQQQALKTQLRKVKKTASGKKAIGVYDAALHAENLRRLALVSAIPTAIRNNYSQKIRSAVEMPIYFVESLLNPRKKVSLEGTMAQLRFTFYDQQEAAVLTQSILGMFPEQRAKFASNYAESVNLVKKLNPSQNGTARLQNGLDTKPNRVLDTAENVLHMVNGLNRFQEAVYRNGHFAASMQRMLIDKGQNDMMKVLRNGELLKHLDEADIEKAVDDALNFTYASEPEFGPFKAINNMLVRSIVGTWIAPFPRFMFKAIEMTYNYNHTGIVHGLGEVLYGSAAGSTYRSDKGFRRIAQGIAGGTPLISLGYYLRDPETGTAGAEFHNLIDRDNNEYNALYYFPLAPYLLIGEMIHRSENNFFNMMGVNVPNPYKIGFNVNEALKLKDFNKWKTEGYKAFQLTGEGRPGKTTLGLPATGRELMQGFFGSTFRGAGPLIKITDDIINSIDPDSDNVQSMRSYARLGEYFGDAASGFGQPIFQFAEVPIRAPSDEKFLHFTAIADPHERRRAYLADPTYESGVGAFMDGFAKPIKGRLDRVMRIFEASDAELERIKEDKRYFAESPIFEQTPVRVLSWMKLLFGATLTKAPPPYYKELGRLGFTYKDFMGKTSNDIQNAEFNKRMGEWNNRYMANLILDAFDNAKKVLIAGQRITDPKLIDRIAASRIRDEISKVRTSITEEIKKLDDGDVKAASMYNRYNSLDNRDKESRERFLRTEMKAFYERDNVDLEYFKKRLGLNSLEEIEELYDPNKKEFRLDLTNIKILNELLSIDFK